MPDETVETRPPWLDFSLPRRPCLGISVLYSIILQTLNSCAIRPPRQHRLPPPPTYATYAEIQCAGPHLRFGRHGALNLYVGSSKPPLLPTRHTKFAGGHAVCSEENYELPRGSIFPNNKKAPAYPQSIRTWARG